MPDRGELRWRLLVDGAADGPTNMARDHALALDTGDGGATLRLYRWSSPTVSLGRNEPARERYDLGAARERGVSFVRRPTGGRAVVHHRELTYAVALPLRALGRLRETYLRVNRALVRGLAALGVRADIARGADVGVGGTAPLDAGPCFSRPAGGEIVVAGGKLVGSAQARIGRMVLQHGSILLADDQDLVGELAILDTATGSGVGTDEDVGPVSLADVLGAPPEHDVLADAVSDGFRQEFGGTWEETSPESITVPVEVEERYRSEAWTWRR